MFNIPARYFARYYEILSVFIRHGLGNMLLSGNLTPMQEGNFALVGVHLRSACAELGPAFIKMGQLASTRSDLLPQPIIQELAKHQDQIRPLSSQHISPKMFPGKTVSRDQQSLDQNNPTNGAEHAN